MIPTEPVTISSGVDNPKFNWRIILKPYSYQGHFVLRYVIQRKTKLLWLIPIWEERDSEYTLEKAKETLRVLRFSEERKPAFEKRSRIVHME